MNTKGLKEVGNPTVKRNQRRLSSMKATGYWSNSLAVHKVNEAVGRNGLVQLIHSRPGAVVVLKMP